MSSYSGIVSLSQCVVPLPRVTAENHTVRIRFKYSVHLSRSRASRSLTVCVVCGGGGKVWRLLLLRGIVKAM